MDENPDKLEGKLVESFEAKELGDLAVVYAELGLDGILDEGIIKDIPILRTVVSLAKIGFNVRDRICIKKIIGFLAQIGQATQEQREEFAENYCRNTKRFEEAVMLILEQADCFEKPPLIGKIFKACILGQIAYNDALKLSSMVNRAYWEDVRQLLSDINVQITEDNHSLVNVGLFEVSIRGGGFRARYDPANIHYKITKYGRLLNQIANS
ncbi:MAG: hypothetical protein NTX52_04980 [Planctomycetota bacterium]|nr:hypothetical protein [Planctomycetota bacterium]